MKRVWAVVVVPLMLIGLLVTVAACGRPETPLRYVTVAQLAADKELQKEKPPWWFDGYKVVFQHKPKIGETVPLVIIGDTFIGKTQVTLSYVRLRYAHGHLEVALEDMCHYPEVHPTWDPIGQALTDPAAGLPFRFAWFDSPRQGTKEYEEHKHPLCSGYYAPSVLPTPFP